LAKTVEARAGRLGNEVSFSSDFERWTATESWDLFQFAIQALDVPKNLHPAAISSAARDFNVQRSKLPSNPFRTQLPYLSASGSDLMRQGFAQSTAQSSAQVLDACAK
jgi:hypothetical protein